jgi:hypothetical protein
MPAGHKVSVSWQTVSVLFPIINVWTAYRIQRLRKWVIIAIPLGLVIGFLIPFPYSLVIYLPIVMYFMAKWSRDWNKKFE